MAQTIVGVFDGPTQATAAHRALLTCGLPAQDVSLVGPEPSGAPLIPDAMVGMAVGAGTGAVLGGAAGLLTSLAGVTLPGVDWQPLLGPVGLLLTSMGVGAGAGAAAGGLVGTLVTASAAGKANTGSPRRDGPVVIVTCPDRVVQTVVDILARHHAVDVECRGENQVRRGPLLQRARLAPAQDSTDTEPAADHAPPPSTARASADQAFQEDFRARFGGADRSFADVEPAYRFGEALARDHRFTGRSWRDLEETAREDWEAQQPGTWEHTRDAIRAAWEHAVR